MYDIVLPNKASDSSSTSSVIWRMKNEEHPLVARPSATNTSSRLARKAEEPIAQSACKYLIILTAQVPVEAITS